MLPVESSLMIVVPEAERLVKPFREKYDPSAAVGVPAHITLLYPFKLPVAYGGFFDSSPGHDERRRRNSFS